MKIGLNKAERFYFALNTRGLSNIFPNNMSVKQTHAFVC